MPGTIGNQNAAGPHKGMAGNTNALKHGLRSALTLGGVPKRLRYVRALAGKFRREIEAAAQQTHGALGPTQIAAVNRATRFELVALFAARELRDGDDKLTLSERMALWSHLTNATESRDKALCQLRLSAGTGGAEDPWDALDKQQTP